METWSFDSPDPDTTAAWAAELGRAIGAEGLAIGLIGPLGAGKTVFVKGLASGLGVDPTFVSSPTFVIAQQYALPATDESAAGASDPRARPVVLHHLDLYRLESEADLESIGFFDLFERGAVLATEWADRFPDVLGPARLDIEMAGPGSDEGEGKPRRTHVRAHGRTAETILEDWAERVERLGRIQRLETRSGAGGDGAARPERPLGWMLAIALALSMSSLAADLDSTLTLPMQPMQPMQDAGPDARSAAVACEQPRERAGDAWGTLRVACGVDEHGLARDRPPAAISGIGGLLFGTALDLNRAGRAELDALPDLGPRRVDAILGARNERPFSSVRDLARVPGIGAKTVARLSPWLKVEAGGG